MSLFESLSHFFQKAFESLGSVFSNIEGFLQSHAYQSPIVYTAVVVFFFLSGLGMPVPEEVILIGAGMVAFIATHPEIYTPPLNASQPVDPYILAAVCFSAVMVADYSVFLLGRSFGRRLLVNRRFRRIVKPQMIRKVRGVIRRNGWLASGIFRFTPGIRFPGHLICGASRFPSWKFLAVDGLAAAFSVPTQVLLIATYGDRILNSLKTFKIAIFSILGLALIYYFVKKAMAKRKMAREPMS